MGSKKYEKVKEPKVPFKRNPQQLAQERHMVSQLALANPGLNSDQLAQIMSDRLGRVIRPRTIRTDLLVMRKDWIKNTEQNFRVIQSKELERVTVLEQEAWEAWRASQQPKIRETVEELARQLSEEDIVLQVKKAAEDATGEELVLDLFQELVGDAVEKSIELNETAAMFVSKITTMTEQSAGDVRYLRMVHEIQQERRRIQGVYAPALHQLEVRRIEIQGYEGGWSPSDWLGDDQIEDGEFEDGDAEEPVAFLEEGE